MNNHCISCGDLIPEGRQICWRCEHSVNKPIFADILDANEYCKAQHWEAYWIHYTGCGYTCGELKGKTHEYKA